MSNMAMILAASPAETPAEAVAAIRRPALLVRAARFALADYRRGTMLRRILRVPVLPRTAAALDALIEIEAALEAARLTGDASYGIPRHVEVLAALMAEQRLVAAPATQQAREGSAFPRALQIVG